jgi:hypothetical protein
MVSNTDDEESEVEISRVIKTYILSTSTHFYVDIGMFVILVFAQILNFSVLIFTKFSIFSYFSALVCGMVGFNLFTVVKSLLKNLKERHDMKYKGLEFCNICKGDGMLIVVASFKSSETNRVRKVKQYGMCKKCEGTGKIDWVQKVIDPRRLS